MTGGNSPIGYLKAYHTNLYLSADSKKVMEALEEGETRNCHFYIFQLNSCNWDFGFYGH